MGTDDQESDDRADPADEETEREGERVIDRESAAAILREVADGVESGTIEIEGDEAFTVTVPERFELEVEYEVTDTDAEFEVELEWPIEDGQAVAAEE